MIKLKDIREGSIVKVRGDFGSGAAVTARVDTVEKNIKNGLPGIDYTVLADNDQRWAYLDQITQVVTY